MPYFITFHTYATWLHGHPRGSVDRLHNIPGTPLLPADAQREAREARLAELPASLDAPMRRVVDQTIREVAVHGSWILHAPMFARTMWMSWLRLIARRSA